MIPKFKDIIDIIVIAFIVYQTIIVLKKNGNVQLIIGILLLTAAYFLTSYMKLEMTNSLLTSIKSMWIIAIIILFQPELRSLLNKLNLTSDFLQSYKQNDDDGYVSSLIDAISAMAFRKIGALIVIENKKMLSEFINAGEIIDAKVSLRLILSIFNPKSVLHDGAIIIRHGRILAAKVVLPLSTKDEYKQQYGTRHLAAIGISEVSDAMAIVVSEQTGQVSVAVNSVIRQDVPFEELMQILTDASKR
jgi:diadenylate cyclase